MTETVDAKLRELRSKTDRQLASLISKRLDRGLEWARSERFAGAAERAFQEACRWMPLLDGTPQRRHMENKLARLRAALGAGRLTQAAACR